jgi:hypothetical protein
MFRVLAVTLLLSIPFGAFAKELYRAPSAGDSGTNFVLKI